MTWQERARQEAAAIIAEAMPISTQYADLKLLTELVAIGWLQGVNIGSHETLGMVERTFGEMRESL